MVLKSMSVKEAFKAIQMLGLRSENKTKINKGAISSQIFAAGPIEPKPCSASCTLTRSQPRRLLSHTDTWINLIWARTDAVAETISTNAIAGLGPVQE